MIDILMESYRDEIVGSLSDFIKINTVKDKELPYKPYGKGVFDGLMFIHSLTDKMGLDCVNMFGHLVYVEYGFGDETLAILTHTDIVPPGDGWTRNPFGGEVVDGRVYGRGAQDNKGPAIAALYAVKALSDNCINLNKKVRVIFGGDEESGSGDILYYKDKEGTPEYLFSPDGDFPIVNCEKGLYHLKLYAKPKERTREGMAVRELQSGTRINVVPNKAYCLLEADFDLVNARLASYVPRLKADFSLSRNEEGLTVINVEGKSAHGSKPGEGINAAAALINFLNTLPLANGTPEQAVRALARLIGANYHGENMELDCADELSGPLTLNLGVVDYLNGDFSAQIDVRYPVNKTGAWVGARLEKYLAADFNLEVLSAFEPHFVPESSPIIQKLKEAYEEVTHDKAYCMAIGGATYARNFENGVTFGPVFPGKPFTGHGPDEYIEIDDLITLSQIILDAIMNICG